MKRLLSLAVLTAALGCGTAQAQYTDGVIKIGVMNDMSGLYSDITGPGSVVAARMAVEDFGAAAKGMKVEILAGDHQNKPDVGSNIVRQWIDVDKVDVIVDVPTSSVALAVTQIVKDKNRVFLVSGAAASDLTGKACSPNTVHWTYDTWALANGTGKAIVQTGGKTWFFITADYAFGHELTRGLKREGKQHGIEVVAEVKHPIAAKDFSAFLPQIQAAKPDVLFLCNFGYDQLNSIKQAIEFGFKNTMRLVVPVLLYTQRLVGGAAYDGVIGGSNYYWELENSIPSAKAFNNTYRKQNNGSPPSDYGAYGYSGVSALLAGTKAAGSTDADKVIAALESLKYDKYKGVQYFRKCDHQSVQSVYIIESKAQAEVKNTYDVFKIVHSEPAGEGILRTCSELGL